MFYVAGGMLIKSAAPGMMRRPFDVGHDMMKQTPKGLSSQSGQFTIPRTPPPPSAPVQRPTPPPPPPTPPAPMAAPVTTPKTPPAPAQNVRPQFAGASKIQPKPQQSQLMAGQSNLTPKATGQAGSEKSIMGTIGDWGHKALELGRTDLMDFVPDSLFPGSTGAKRT